ncbi:MAG: zinc ABC transporter substrate-binding protein [Phycisphaerales bacterium]|nr:zinc ABC transporter substrate-binding protein [Phycisphaerales bacterium]
MNRVLLCLCALCLLSLACCGPSEPASEAQPGATSDGPITIVATIGMIGDIVERVAGDRAEVEVLVGPGVDPHLYQPTRGDMESFLAADMIFYNGLMLEGRMTDALVRAATANRGVYAVTELLDPDMLMEAADYEDASDPHVWMDPTAWTKAVEVIRDRLIERDPDGRTLFESNATALIEELATLDEYCQRVLGSVPEGERVIISAHDAFGYFGRRFGYEVLGIQGLSTASEAGLRDIERLVDTLVDRNIGAVFVESTVSDRNVEALIAGAAARGHTVSIGGELFSDALGPVGTYEGTYIGMIDHNATTIARGLGGEAPEDGMQGKLTP